MLSRSVEALRAAHAAQRESQEALHRARAEAEARSEPAPEPFESKPAAEVAFAAADDAALGSRELGGLSLRR